MDEMKTALEVLREIAGITQDMCPCNVNMVSTSECNTSKCLECFENAFRAHVIGYAKAYPEGGE